MMQSARPTIKRRQLPALTLLEILLSVAVLGVLIAIALPYSQGLLYRDELQSTVSLCAKALYVAEQNAKSGNADDVWGVHFQSGQIIIFKGANFAARDTSADIVTVLSSRVGFSGDTEVLFSKMTGYPDAATTFNVIANNSSAALTVSSRGRISY